MPVRSLVVRDPFLQDAFDFRRNFDDLFSRFYGNTGWDRFSAAASNNNNFSLAFIPPIETFVDKNKYHVRLALPGINPRDVNIQAHGNELTVSGERRQETSPSSDSSDDRRLQCEIVYGAFERVIALPEGVQADKIEASFRDGVLEVLAPINEKALPRRIEIKGATGNERDRKLAA